MYRRLLRWAFRRLSWQRACKRLLRHRLLRRIRRCPNRPRVRRNLNRLPYLQQTRLNLSRLPYLRQTRLNLSRLPYLRQTRLNLSRLPRHLQARPYPNLRARPRLLQRPSRHLLRRPNPVGLTWDRPVPIGEDYTLRNANELTLRVRENRVYWANDAWEIIDEEHNLNNKPPRGFEYLLIDIQVRGPNTDGSEYDASLRLTAEGAPPDGNEYRWSGANHCGGIPETRIKFDFALKRPDDTYGRRGNICFVVTRDDSGKLVLVDNGGPGAPEGDRRYFSLRR